MDKLESRGNAAARLSALFGMIALVGFVLMTNFDVVMRSFFNSPVNGITDIAPLIIAIVVAAFFPYALVERYHVAIEFVGVLLDTKTRARLNAMVALVTLGFFILLAWQIIIYTIDLHESGQTTWVVQIPSAPWWAVACFFLLLCVAVQFSIFLSQLLLAIGGGADDSAPIRANDGSPTNSGF